MFFSKIGNRLETMIMFILIVITCLLIVVGSAQIFFRYVVNYSLFWSEELMRYLFVWLVMLGIGVGVRHNAHVAVDALNYVLSAKSQKAASIFIGLLGLALFATLAWLGGQLSLKYMHQLSPAIRLPMGAVYLAIPLGSLLSCFFHLEQIFITAAQKKVNS